MTLPVRKTERSRLGCPAYPDQTVTIPAYGWYEPHDIVLESIRLTGEKVIPHLR